MWKAFAIAIHNIPEGAGVSILRYHVSDAVFSMLNSRRVIFGVHNLAECLIQESAYCGFDSLQTFMTISGLLLAELPYLRSFIRQLWTVSKSDNLIWSGKEQRTL